VAAYVLISVESQRRHLYARLRCAFATSLNLYTHVLLLLIMLQFRYAGAKGMLTLCNDMPAGQHLALRPSQIKFESDHRVIEVNLLLNNAVTYITLHHALLLI
jgi:RNA dependent RNA polymerase